MSKLFGRFDEVNIGASLALTFGDQIVQTSLSVDAHRISRSQLPMSTFAGYVECYIYSPDGGSPSLSSVSGVPPIAIGVVLGTDSLSKFVGEDVGGYGYCPGDGKVYHNNAVVATFATCPLNTYVGVLLDPVANLLTFYSNGQPLGTLAITSGQTWYYASTVSGNPGDLGIFANAGQTPQRFPQRNTGGWWTPSAALTPIFIATEPFLTQPTDAAPNLKYNGDIERMQSPLKIERSVKVWTWGKSMPPVMSSTTQAQLTILDPDHLYDALLTQDVRDQLVVISRQPQDTANSSNEAAFTGIIDHVVANTDQTKTIYVTDAISLLDVPQNRSLYAPNADPSVALKPRTLALGICRNYAPELFDATNFLYGSHDSYLNALGNERIAGKPLVFGTDVFLLPDASGFRLPSATGSKFTAESTSEGSALPPVTSDLLSGSGNFATATPDSNGHPTGWIVTESGYGSNPTPIWQLTTISGSQYVRTPNMYDVTVNLIRDPSAFALTAGLTYNIQITIAEIPNWGTGLTWDGSYVHPAILYVGIATGNSTVGYQVTANQFNLTKTGTFNFQVSVPTGLTGAGLGISFESNTLYYTGGIFSYLGISSIQIQQAPSVAANVPLSGPTLTQMLQAIAIERGPLTAAQISFAESSAIDTATGYSYGIFHSANDQPQVKDDIKTLLDCVCSDLYQGRDGLLHVFQLIAPELVSSGQIAGSLTVTDFDGYLLPWPDNAEGLTTHMVGGRNYSPYTDGDFGQTTLTDCPTQVRALLKQDYQWTAVAAVTLATKYAPYATSAAPLKSLFDVLAHGAAEITRVGTIYEQDRNFYVGTVFTPIGRPIDIGQVWNVTYPVGNLVVGQNLLVVHVGDSPSEETNEVVLWGL